jgi:hypothetical protein
VARRVRLLVYIDLVQDIDVLLPVLLESRTRPGLELGIVVARWLETAAPRVATLLRHHALPYRTLPRRRVIEGQGPLLWRVDGLLTASESDQDTHRAGQALTIRARRKGLATFTLQHGIDSLSPPEAPNIAFASETILTWFTSGGIPETVGPGTRARLVSVGRPVLSPEPGEARYDVGLFENLHAARYSDAEREEFRARAIGLIRQRPDLSFYIRPHPAGPGDAWTGSGLDDRPNVTHASPAEAVRNPLSGRAAVAGARRVITTPSTVAFDAASADRPVALAFDGGPLYSGLPVLQSDADWLDFAADTDTTSHRVFLARFQVGTDPARAVIDHLMTILTRPPGRPLTKDAVTPP